MFAFAWSTTSRKDTPCGPYSENSGSAASSNRSRVPFSAGLGRGFSFFMSGPQILWIGMEDRLVFQANIYFNMDAPRVGYIGLGDMGGLICAALMRAAITTVVFDIAAEPIA